MVAPVNSACKLDSRLRENDETWANSAQRFHLPGWCASNVSTPPQKDAYCSARTKKSNWRRVT